MDKIGIIQLDGKIPNLALMKVAGYHETLGDIVEWYEGLLFAEQYKKIYASKLFSFTVFSAVSFITEIAVFRF